MFSFLKSYIHFGCCAVLLQGVEVYEFEEFPGDSKEHRTPQPLSFGFPAHFGSNCLCNYVAKLSSTIEVEKKKTLPTTALLCLYVFLSFLSIFFNSTWKFHFLHYSMDDFSDVAPIITTS